MFLDQNKSKIFDLYLDGDEQDILKDTIIRKTLEERKAEVISELSSNPDQNLVMKIFDRRRKDIMEIMVERSRQQILDKALSKICCRLRSTIISIMSLRRRSKIFITRF